MKTKVIVHLKSGKKLAYYDDDADPKRDWTGYLATSGSVRFGRYVVPKDYISHVEFDY